MKLNKLIQYSFIALLSALSFISCKKDDIEEPVKKNILDQLKLVTTFKNESDNIEIYTKSGKFTQGYNDVYFQVKNSSGEVIAHEAQSWMPMMKMTMKSHSCPFSEITKVADNPMVSSGFIIFNMASDDMGSWKLTINYTVDDVEKVAEGEISVQASARRVTQGFKGSDSIQYFIALIEPSIPKEGPNVMKAGLYKMEADHTFSPIGNYKVLIDPRMPGMGNHSSPNNEDLISQGKGIYNGKVNFSMTGYWKINLQVENESGVILKGEAITEETESSSIFFEVEF
ncbi:MAG TPA: FixH family protein [Chitinophagales bacterium]|nr:FixH family protein [Chitinophagales bacterium]